MLNISKYIVTIILGILYLNSWAQTASIKSDDEVCLNEVLPFNLVTTGSPTTYAWSFGDGGTSSQRSPAYTYSTAGSMNVSVTVTYAGGTTKKVDKVITVHDLPTADFQVNSTGFCFFNQNICLTDKSTMGTTTSGYGSRIILWGTGAQTSSNSPSSGNVACYSSYPTMANNPYTIIVEVVNDKGCEDKWEQDISILKDYKPKFNYGKQGSACDVQEVCFTNDSATKRSDIQSFEWDFGDGTKNTVDWNNLCHDYTSSGIYTVTLKVKLKNGCESKIERIINIKVTSFNVTATVQDSILCFPQVFKLNSVSVPSALYKWTLYDSSHFKIKDIGTNIIEFADVECPGDYYVQLQVTVGSCVKLSRKIKIVSEGVYSLFEPLNDFQCNPQDTVYFLNTSKEYHKANVTYSWIFNDPVAPNCIGVANNCNSDTSYHSKHFYSTIGCFNPKLIATDLVSGCKSESVDLVSIVDPITNQFDFDMNKPCLGGRPDYGVRFSSEKCSGEIKVCLDSFTNSNMFVPLEDRKYFYGLITNSQNYVTVGFAILAGNEKVYRSADSTDYYIDKSRVCQDTIWKHKWFQLFREPSAFFSSKRNGLCLPVEIEVSYFGSEQSKIKYLTYQWEFGGEVKKDTVETNTIDTLRHTYTSEGRKDIFIQVEDSVGCYGTTSLQERIGYANTIKSDTILCPGVSVTFIDSIRYYNDNVNYWSMASRPESMSWDFDDGQGFVTNGPTPSKIFNTKGRYIVKMASVDKNGCTDTAYLPIIVSGVNAAVKYPDKDYLCDQILQLFDSSYFDIEPSPDFIKKYRWNFGDNSTESYLKNPFHYYKLNGRILVTLSVESNNGCIDTAKFPIYIKGPEPYFDITSDTVGCVPFTASFSSSSTNVTSFIWRMGDESNTIFSHNRDTSFSFTYDKPGTYYISLEGSDSFYNEASQNKYTCSSIFPNGGQVRRIVVLPIPEVSLEWDNPICLGQPVTFRNTSDEIYTQFDWLVEGQNEQSGATGLTHTFSSVGSHDIVFTPTYTPTGPYQRACYDTFMANVYVAYVEAAFNLRSEGKCSNYFFADSSKFALTYLWNFDHPESEEDNISTEKNPSHKYGKDKGEYNVCLTVESAEECVDSACRPLSVEYFKDLKKYNVFTPNNDGFNDEFLLDVINQKEYDLKIYNRYGERVFRTQDPTIGWNGSFNNVGKDLPEGSYFYVLKYGFNCENVERIAEGLVDLIRSK